MSVKRRGFKEDVVHEDQIKSCSGSQLVLPVQYGASKANGFRFSLKSSKAVLNDIAMLLPNLYKNGKYFARV